MQHLLAEVVDPLKDELVPIAKTQRQNPLAFIENQSLFGDLAKNQIFASAYLEALTSMFEVGAHQTLVNITNG